MLGCTQQLLAVDCDAACFMVTDSPAQQQSCCAVGYAVPRCIINAIGVLAEHGATAVATPHNREGLPSGH